MDESLMLAILILVTFVWLSVIAIIYLHRMRCPWYLIIPVSVLVGMVIYITTRLTLDVILIATL